MKYKILFLFAIPFLIACSESSKPLEQTLPDFNSVPAKDTPEKNGTAERIVKVYKDTEDSLKSGMQKFNSGYHRIMRESTGMEFARADYSEALELLYPLRERKFFKAEEQNALGLLLESNKKAEEAVKYYQLSADAKHKNGIYNLATCYEYGTGVEKDLKKAGALYLQSAKLGNGLAMTVVAKNLSKFNDGMFPPNLKEAVMWYEKSLTKKDDIPYDRLESVYKTLMEYYLEGVGVERSVQKAEMYGKLYEEQKKFNQSFYSDRFFDH